MDKKDNNTDDAYSNPINWKSLGFFSAEEYLIYVFKKTEKIAAALYLVSGLLKDDEPLKWELRDKGMDLLSSSFTAASAIPGDKSGVIQSLFTAALETISLLNVAKISNLISPMNHTILSREIDNIVSMLKDRLAESAENAGYVLSEQFFKLPNLYTTGFRNDSKSGKAGSNLTENVSNNDIFKKRLNDTDISRGHGNMEEKKTRRRESIMNALRVQSNLTIKDFTKVITDCSEKTIQRELSEMVEKGLIKKEGDRRWSRYSL